MPTHVRESINKPIMDGWSPRTMKATRLISSAWLVGCGLFVSSQAGRDLNYSEIILWWWWMGQGKVAAEAAEYGLRIAGFSRWAVVSISSLLKVYYCLLIGPKNSSSSIDQYPRGHGPSHCSLVVVVYTGSNAAAYTAQLMIQTGTVQFSTTRLVSTSSVLWKAQYWRLKKILKSWILITCLIKCA
jgi:hypothetical protein